MQTTLVAGGTVQSGWFRMKTKESSVVMASCKAPARTPRAFVWDPGSTHANLWGIFWAGNSEKAVVWGRICGYETKPNPNSRPEVRVPDLRRLSQYPRSMATPATTPNRRLTFTFLSDRSPASRHPDRQRISGSSTCSLTRASICKVTRGSGSVCDCVAEISRHRDCPPGTGSGTLAPRRPRNEGGGVSPVWFAQ